MTAGIDEFITQYRALYERLYAGGYKDEIDWQQNLKPCDNPGIFLGEYVWVVIHAGMCNAAATKIYRRFVDSGYNCDTIGHPSKRLAIMDVTSRIRSVFAGYQAAPDRVAYLETLPWIGPVTKWHLAKNLGMDHAKPDRHLVRIAGKLGMDPDTLCRTVAAATGHRVATVDLVIWRAANLKMI